MVTIRDISANVEALVAFVKLDNRRRSPENEGILLANLGGQGSQPGKTGNPGLGQRPFLEPSPQPVHIDGCRGGQVL